MSARPAELVSAVRGLLTSAPAFAQLRPDERNKIARDLSRVLEFVTDPGAGDPELARTLDDSQQPGAVDQLKQRLAQAPGQVGADFKAGAAREGAQVWKSLVGSVDFPNFVAGLIDGVFNSIVTSSIRQMREYGKMLEAVVKSLEEFAQDHVTPIQARQYMVDSFPDSLQLSNQVDDSGTSKLALKDDVDSAPDFQTFLGGNTNFSLDDPEAEQKVVQAAQLKMARMRQQELAMMVVLGINRITVTEGEINAKVSFDIKSSDTASRHAAASMDDARAQGFGWWDDGFYYNNVAVSTAHSDITDDSDSRLNAKANLTGSVSVKFKSETFPLDRIASPADLLTVSKKSRKGDQQAEAKK